MAINYADERNDQEQQLRDMLTQSGAMIPTQIDQTRQNAIVARKPVLDRLAQVAGPGMTPAVNASLMEQTPKINRTLDTNLARRKMMEQRMRDSLIFENAVRMAKESGLSMQAAQNFARKYMATKKQNEFQGAEADKERGQRLAMQDVREQYINRGMDADAQAAGTSSADAALLRVLLGTGTAIGTGYALNRYGVQQPTAKTSNNTAFKTYEPDPYDSFA